MNNSTENIQTNIKWFYVIIQNPETSAEQYVGFSDSKTQEKFIPAFITKDQAMDCFALMPKDLFNGRYDTQAVIEDDLIAVANDNGHKIYLLDEKGCILKQLN